MERKYVVLFCLLAIVLLSGCSVILYPKSTTENYKLGYQDGLMAAYKSTEGATHGLIGENYYTPSKLPDPQQQKSMINLLNTNEALLMAGEEALMMTLHSTIGCIMKLTKSIAIRIGFLNPFYDDSVLPPSHYRASE